ncbi:hypothetical protein AB4059_04015 [Lysobacter sp. 2RAF19]
MTSKPFLVHDVQELRTMQRVFREAKFCTEADDDEVSESPTVARLFERLMASLIDAEVAISGDSARDEWNKWLLMTDSSRDEWAAALGRARKNRMWQTWTEKEKKACIRTLFSPFVLSDSMVDSFLVSV